MKNNTDKFRNAMTKSREEQKFTKTQLATMTNKSISMVCDIEAAIAIALGISLDTIFLN